MIALVVSCSVQEDTAQRSCTILSLKTPSVSDSLSYQIVNEIITMYHLGTSSPYFSQQTQQSTEAQFLDYDLVDFLSLSDTAIIRSYNESNVQPLNWDPSLLTNVRIINQDEILCVLSFGWDDFDARYFGSDGFLQFGRPFVDSTGKAIVEYSYYCGDICGNGFIVLLQREGDSWNIVKRAITWQA